jgi:uncharacterized protein DUF4383
MPSFSAGSRWQGEQDSGPRGRRKTYCQIGGVIYIVLTIPGFVAPTTFGLIPIGRSDIWLHALLGIVLAAVGFTARPVSSPNS